MQERCAIHTFQLKCWARCALPNLRAVSNLMDPLLRCLASLEQFWRLYLIVFLSAVILDTFSLLVSFWMDTHPCQGLQGQAHKLWV